MDGVLGGFLVADLAHHDDVRILPQDVTQGRGIGDADLVDEGPLPAGQYKIHFSTGEYFAAMESQSFYPYVEVIFEVSGDGQHYHVPLLLNPFGYSTYRGS